MATQTFYVQTKHVCQVTLVNTSTKSWTFSEWTACSTGATGRTAINGCPSRSDSRSFKSTSWARDNKRPRSTSGGIRSNATSGSSGPPASRNGNLMLHVPLPNNGMPDDKELKVLDAIAQWIAVNSDGI